MLLLALATLVEVPTAYASPTSGFCNALRAFVVSVQPGETREFTFRTSWGANFKDATEPAIFAKRCEHEGYAQAEKVCEYLTEHGSVEFAGVNVKSAISCLSPKTGFDPRLDINAADFHFRYGSDDRGALINVTFKEDPALGGMAFRLVADGY
ncbi:MAG: hypothetical protein QM761_15025 [Pseudoxanthomonas sp.]